MFLLFAYNCSKHLRIHEFDLAVFGKDWMGSLLSALLLIYSSELIVDWSAALAAISTYIRRVKHTTVCNYNHYAPRVYAEIENELKREAALLPHSLSVPKIFFVASVRMLIYSAANEPKWTRQQAHGPLATATRNRCTWICDISLSVHTLFSSSKCSAIGCQRVRAQRWACLCYASLSCLSVRSCSAHFCNYT